MPRANRIGRAAATNEAIIWQNEEGNGIRFLRHYLTSNAYLDILNSDGSMAGTFVITEDDALDFARDMHQWVVDRRRGGNQ